MKKIYLDHAATTPLDERVLEAMKPYFVEKFGNASSIHSFGQEARAAVDASRQTIADFLNCQPSEIIFTSGGSESDNLAIRGIVDSVIPTKVEGSSDKLEVGPSGRFLDSARRAPFGARNDKILPHVITSAFEHHAVFDTIRELEAEGKIEAIYIKPSGDGIVSVKDIEKAIKPNTVLVSIMYVNNEIGTVQPIREIGKLIEKINLGRFEKPNEVPTKQSLSGSRSEGIGTNSAPKGPLSEGANEANFLENRIYFHTDAVQATEYFNMDTKYLHVDMLTLSAHKIYGPKGVGVLFIKKDTPIKHQIIGGGQEYKMRAGTENVAGIVGMAKAIALTQNSKLKTQSYNLKLKTLRDKLIDGIGERISDAHLNGSRELRSPNNVNVTFHNAEGESILLNLDAEGIAASSGSACTSGSLEPSHVLMALGQKAEEAHGSIRFTLGRDTTEADIDRVLEVLPGIIKKLREMSPYK
jgi:cysteine desulfurase